MDLKKESFVGREALAAEAKKGGPARSTCGLGNELERSGSALRKNRNGSPGALTASRVAVPVYRAGRQVGKATSTTWSPTLKRMIALASVGRESAALGTTLSMELTVEAVAQNRLRESRASALLQSSAQNCAHRDLRTGNTALSISKYAHVISTIPTVHARPFTGFRRLYFFSTARNWSCGSAVT